MASEYRIRLAVATRLALDETGPRIRCAGCDRLSILVKPPSETQTAGSHADNPRPKERTSMSSQSDRTILTFTIKDDEGEVDAARRFLKEWNNLLTGSAVEPAVLQADAGFRRA
jgi:hypothetical protein